MDLETIKTVLILTFIVMFWLNLRSIKKLSSEKEDYKKASENLAKDLDERNQLIKELANKKLGKKKAESLFNTVEDIKNSIKNDIKNIKITAMVIPSEDLITKRLKNIGKFINPHAYKCVDYKKEAQEIINLFINSNKNE